MLVFRIIQDPMINGCNFLSRVSLKNKLYKIIFNSLKLNTGNKV